MTRTCAIYVRVSTPKKNAQDPTLYEQNPEVQKDPLLALSKMRGWNCFKVYSDRESGSKESRPGLNALMDDARRGCFDVVLVWRFDRFARSVKQLVGALEEFRSIGIDFISHQEALDTSTPMGKAMFTIIAALAELERNITRERVLAGMDHARRHGTKSGRDIGRPKRVFRRDEVLDLRAKGWSYRKIAVEFGVGTMTIKRACSVVVP